MAKSDTSRAVDKAAAGHRAMHPGMSLNENMNRVFDNYFGDSIYAPFARSPSSGILSRSPGIITPKVDITESEKDIKLTAELPGMDEDDIELVFSDGMLTIKGEKSYEREDENENVHVMGRSYGSFKRSFKVPDYVMSGKIDAKFDKGVLTVTMPRRPDQAKAEKKIKIKK